MKHFIFHVDWDDDYIEQEARRIKERHALETMEIVPPDYPTMTILRISISRPEEIMMFEFYIDDPAMAACLA